MLCKPCPKRPDDIIGMRVLFFGFSALRDDEKRKKEMG